MWMPHEASEKAVLTTVLINSAVAGSAAPSENVLAARRFVSHVKGT